MQCLLFQDLRETAERRVETAIGSREPARLILLIMRWTFLMKHVNLIGTGHTAKETRHRRTRESDPRPPRQTQWAWLRAWTHCEGMDAPWATNILVTVILVTYSGDSTWLLRGKEKWKRKNVCLRLGTNLRLPGILVKAKALGDHSASCHHCQHPWLLRSCCPAQCCSFLQEVSSC